MTATPASTPDSDRAAGPHVPEPPSRPAPDRVVLPATMRAVVQHGFGGPEVMGLAEVPVPAIGDDEVLVAVQAAGMDRGTWHLLHGRPLMVRPSIGLRRPRRPVMGLDLAGTVVAVGARVTRFAVGDRVAGIGRGSFAPYAAARERKLVHAPADLPWPQAAVLAVSGLTAYQALHRSAQVGPGMQVLVLGASGAVGSYAVQVAKAAGAEVTAVCSTAKVGFVRALGADHVIDRTREDVAASGRRYDVVVDIAGDPSLKTLRGLLTPTGTAVIVGSEQGGRLLGGFDRQLRAAVVSPFGRQRLAVLVSSEDHEDLQRLVDLVEAGAVTPAVGAAVPLEQAAEAMRRLEAGEVRGKVAILVGAG
jgi:NADPH:quinone reductase-like Zn-dependent oxidoreductase